MSDFERTFGAGVDAVDIINDFSRDDWRSRIDCPEEYLKEIFETYKQASDWSKRNNGRAFKPHPYTNGYMEV